ncbi:MAG: DUF5694 domain-containing protein [Candidatus Aminicenantes bacterium]
MQPNDGMSLRSIIAALVWIYFFGAFGVFAQSTPFQKDTKVPAAKISESEASQVLILGTVHLRAYGEDFNRKVMDRLLDILEKYRPDLIGIESLAPIVTRDMVNSRDANDEIIEEFGQRTAEFGKKTRAALDVSWVEAKAKVETLLADIRVSEKNKKLNQLRKELVLYFLAADDIYSALLQWFYLPKTVRPSVDRLDKDIIHYFTKHIQSPNENVSIGIALASRLNHQRIYAINDHRDKEDFIKIADHLSKELEKNEFLRNQPWKALYEELSGIQTKSYSSGDLLPLYVYLNSREYVKRDIENQWQVLFKANLPSGLAHTRIAYWDVRNLGVAANIRRAMALHPGQKMLVVIGASHKGFLDALLAECMDVKVVHLANILSSKDN